MVKSPEVIEMKKKHNETIKELQVKVEEKQKDYDLLERENKSLLVCCDVDVDEHTKLLEKCDKLNANIRYYERAVKDANEIITKLNNKIERQEQIMIDSLEDVRKENCKLQDELCDLTEKHMILKGKKSEKKQKEKEKKQDKKKKDKKKLKELQKKVDSDESGSDSESD